MNRPLKQNKVSRNQPTHIWALDLGWHYNEFVKVHLSKNDVASIRYPYGKMNLDIHTHTEHSIPGGIWKNWI